MTLPPGSPTLLFDAGWRAVRQAQDHLGWSDEKLSGHIQKHYLGMPKVMLQAPIGDWSGMDAEMRRDLLEELHMRYDVAKHLDWAERHAQLGLKLGQQFSGSRCRSIASCVDAMNEDQLIGAMAALSGVNSLDGYEALLGADTVPAKPVVR